MKKIYILILLFTSTIGISQIATRRAPTIDQNINPTDPNNPNGPIELDPIELDPNDPTTPIFSSSEVGSTKGNLSVSLTGAATYNIPFSVPPGINGVVPQIGLAYSSQSGNGLAGYGWNISGLSSITRLPSTKFHDGAATAVNLSASDRFALDGQRLILKSGTYGSAGSEYETENYSNIKISLLSGTTNYFKVQYPDGSIAYYGYSADSNSNLVFALTYWENAQGLRISYHYNKTNNYLYINSIKYGSVSTTNPINEIQFVYIPRNNVDESYVWGIKIVNDKILSEVKVFGNAVGYRNYLLNHDAISSYQRLISITEKTGDNSKSYNPTTFNYENPTNTFSVQKSYAGKPPTFGYTPVGIISGDFNDDGELDVIRYPQYGKYDFQDNSVNRQDKYVINYNLRNTDPTAANNNSNIGFIKTISGRFTNIFTMNYLKNNGPDYKLSNGNAWCEVTFDAVTNLTSFNVYSISNSVINTANLEYTRQYSFPKFCFYKSLARPTGNYNSTTNKEYYSGDFNGDKLTDLIVVERGETPNDIETTMCTPSGVPFQAGKTYFVNLDKRIANNYVNFSGNIEISQKNIISGFPGQSELVSDNVIHATDVNGDGKTDIVVIKSDYYSNTTTFTVYSLNSSNVLENIFTNVFLFHAGTDYKTLDINGDGRMDFATSTSNCLISTGNSFILKNTPSANSYFDLTYSSIILSDVDKDGKTDALTVDINTPGILKIYFKKNVNGKFLDHWYPHEINVTLNNLSPVYLTSLDSSNSSEFCLTDLSGTFYRFNFGKNFSKEKLLKSVYAGDATNEFINYVPLKHGNDVYTKANSIENYPNYDLGTTIDFKTVESITKLNASIYKTQKYKYYGAVSNLEGLNFIGFRSVLKTNWFEYTDLSKVISGITKFDITKRGAPVESFSVLGIVSPTLSLTPVDPFINKSITTYNNENTSYEDPLLSNKVFKLKITNTKNFNGLENISNETSTQYNNNNSPIQVTTHIKNGSTVEETSVDNFVYDSAISAPYMIDRPLSKTSTTTIFPSNDTTISEELYTYNSNLLTQVKKKGNNTVYITEDNVYDIFGNITKKTLSAPGLAPRIADYEYDTSNRFIAKKIDIERLETLYNYDPNNGWIVSETLPSNPGFPLKTTYLYDKWGKIIKKTDYLGINENYQYANLFDGSGVVKTTTGDDGSSSTIQIDNSGKEIRRGIKNIDGNWSYIDSEYDLNDKIILKSQPYSSSRQVWNETNYDEYGRLSQAISLKSGGSPGKTISYTYSGLTTTENDGQKSKVTIRNASGQVISLTETPGGTITYSYFANGNLKTSNCNGAITTLTQDGWGRKKELDDSSAGIRKYDYNHFGELIKEEVVGQGETSYDLNSVGKVNFKIIKDDGGNIKSKNTYTYDPTTKLLTKVRFDDYANSTFTNNDYSFDGYKRLINSIEVANLRARFERIIDYDGSGRPLTESYLATNLSDGKQSNRTITNTYKNGNKWKILDNTTGITLWQTNTVNAQGQLLSAKLGNLIEITNTYDSFGFPTQISHNKGKMANIMTLDTEFEPIYGNLTKRSNTLFGVWNETITYDQLDRLTSYKDNVGIQNQSYNPNGTILNNNIGSYAYTISGKPYQVSSVTPADQSLTSPVLNYYIPRTQDITYNLFKSPVTITEANTENIDFEYNGFNGRTAMYYGGLQTVKTQRPYFKFYSDDGTMEIKRKTTSPTTVEFITYIGGDAYTAPVILKSDGTNQNFFYLHRDYQGTIVGITNSTGVIVEKRLFDVWGSLIKYANNSGVITVPTSSTSLFIDRGYTGHEHLLGVGLINMNGRIYDPKLHRFLQPDNNLQDPYNTQNYNRYSYVLNNPTKYADPSGEFWGFVIGFLVSTYVHGAQATGNANPLQWNAGEFLNAALGAASTAVSYSVTNAANNYINNYGAPTQSQMNYINANPVNSANSKEITVLTIHNFFSQINDNFHQGLEDRVDDVIYFFGKQVNNSLYWANTLKSFMSDVQNGRSLMFNSSKEYQLELFNGISSMSVNDWAYVAGYSAPDIAVGFVAPIALESIPVRVGSFENSLRKMVVNSFELHPRITHPYFSSTGNATRGFGYGQFDIGHRSASFLRESIIMDGNFGIKNYNTIYFNYSNGGQNFSIGANPWTRTIFHEGPGIFK